MYVVGILTFSDFFVFFFSERVDACDDVVCHLLSAVDRGDDLSGGAVAKADLEVLSLPQPHAAEVRQASGYPEKTPVWRRQREQGVLTGFHHAPFRGPIHS